MTAPVRVCTQRKGLVTGSKRQCQKETDSLGSAILGNRSSRQNERAPFQGGAFAKSDQIFQIRIALGPRSCSNRPTFGRRRHHEQPSSDPRNIGAL